MWALQAVASEACPADGQLSVEGRTRRRAEGTSAQDLLVSAQVLALALSPTASTQHLSLATQLRLCRDTRVVG